MSSQTPPTRIPEPAEAAVSAHATSGRIWPYVQIARPDHWFKNAFMLLGVVLAFFYRPDLATLASLPTLLLAVAVSCIVASSNYVLNELLDAHRDRHHPTKRHRPAAAGLIQPRIAIAEWLALAVLGIGAGFAINVPFGLSAAALWVMGCAYNIPPVRTKEVPYLDVLSESVNNPIRLMLGWSCLIPSQIPPISLLLSYWMAAAFFMATKRFAEYREIGDKEVAAAYRSSFRHYDDDRLLVSMMFYVTAGALCGGIFLVRYKLELVFSVPLVAGFFAYYLRLGLKPDSPVQNPEKLHRERAFLVYGLLTAAVFVGLMFADLPFLYEWARVQPAGESNLWHVPR
ncbi:MAG: UbiA prenyltransferase family protein [Planctomycetota bacterium]